MNKMDVVAFFRMAIPITLALFCVGLILALNVIFIGNAVYVLKNCFKKRVNITVVKNESSKDKTLSTLEPKPLDESLPKAG